MRTLLQLCTRLGLCGAACVATASPGAQAIPAADPPMATGAQAIPIGAQARVGLDIYRKGILPSGQPLRGERAAGIRVEGEAAACERCHRRSGFGLIEGQIIIPAITGTFLFSPRGRDIENLDRRYKPGYQPGREPYDDATLAQAIRQGTGRQGQTLDYLMPRYALNDEDMASLIAYLKRLSVGPFPGVSEQALDFATIITPDTDPLRREAMLAVMNQFVADKDNFQKGGRRLLKSNQGINYRVSRPWRLHVWQVTGAPDAWEKQLDADMAADPVFAVISGLGGRTWAPVHRFCERRGVPCILPNVDLPVDAEDFYNVYYSRGVLLEAAMIAQRLRSASPAPRRLIQVLREGDVGADAAQVLAELWQGPPLIQASVAQKGVAQIRVLRGGESAEALRRVLQDVRGGDALVLWLRASDLRMLPATLAADTTVFLSGIMGGLDKAPVPPPWREAALMTYPFDLPRQRGARMQQPLEWLKGRHIPVVDERLQTDTYITCGIVSEMFTEMLDYFVPDLFVERMETMLPRHLINGYYPRLSIAVGQRFASKGGYFVRFRPGEPGGVVADGGWTVP